MDYMYGPFLLKCYLGLRVPIVIDFMYVISADFAVDIESNEE